MSDKAIFLLVSGEYSDYRVHGAYTSETDAQRVARLMGDDFSVEEVALDAHLDLVAQGCRMFRVDRLVNGEWHASFGEPWDRRDDLGKVRSYKGGPCTGYEVKVLADSREQALKAGMERIRQHIAMQGVELPPAP